MTDLNLNNDESIVLEAEDVQKIGQQNERVVEMYLTNQNLIHVIQTKNGLFSKPTKEIIKIPLNEIKIINGEVQVNQTKNNDYGICLQIQFMNGRELFVFDSPRRTVPKWVNEIHRILVGEVPKEVKQKNSPLAGLSGFTSNLKAAADSAVHTVSTTAKQVTETVVEQTSSTIQSAKEQYQNNKNIEDDIQSEKEKVIYCSNCGEKLTAGAKFCPSCGNAVGEQAVQEVPPIPQKTNDPSKRQHEYAGVIIKCPNCGMVITQTTAICPGCGIRITGQSAVSSVQRFNEQLMEIEGTLKKPGLGRTLFATVDPADQKKLSLIRSFPIPNTIDDILEFMMLAVANIDVGLSKNTMMNRYQGAAKSGESNLTMPKTISDAWVSKMQQAYQKAEIAFPNDPAFLNIKQIYLNKMKELKIKVE